jgi:hypothetical protein
MAAAALSLALVGYWGVLGVALLSVLYTGRRTCQRLLVAPAVGIVVTVLPTFWLNRSGLPVGRFGPALAVALLLGSLAALAWRRPLVPLRHYAPFGAALLTAGLLTGRPMLTFGLDWLSVVNDDMTNYCLLAQRLLTRGFFEPPALEALNRGLDYSGYFFWTYHLVGPRPGAELLLAWLTSVTRLNPHQVFMPCILAAHMALVGAVTALVYQTRRHRPAAILAGWLLAAGALVSLGALYQLIAQVMGLSLLAALAAVLLQPAWSARPIRRLGLAVLVGLLGAALVVVYTEVVPFAGVAIVACLAAWVARRRRSLRSLAWVLAPAGLVALVSLHTHTWAAARFLLRQSRGGIGSFDETTGQSLFPYLFLPSGLAQATGLQPLALVRWEPWLSLSIVLGAALFLLAFAAALRLARRGEPVAFITTTMLVAGVGLVAMRAAFGLFKIILYLQPFMLATLALGWLRLGRRRLWWTLALAVLAAGNLAAQAAYVEQSRGTGSMSELPSASTLRIPAAFHEALRSAAPGSLDLDTGNIVLAKIQALYFDGTPATFLTRDFLYEDIGFYGIASTRGEYRARIPPEWRQGFDVFHDAVASRRAIHRFPLGEGGDGNAFSAPRPGTTAERVPGGALALTTGTQSVFNRHTLGHERAAILVKPYAEISNHLVFVASQLGQHYYRFADRRRVSLYQLEDDPLYPGRTMAAVGRHLLFRIVNPGPSIRLVLDVSASFKGDGESRLPPAAVLGATRFPLPLVGAGAARVFSPPLTAREIDGASYLAIDMGADSARIPVPRTGLMRAYGQDVAIDGRRIVVFVRDISLVPDDAYAAQTPPRSLERLPQDLANAALEYSGIYEDGWIAEHASVHLARPPGASLLAVRGMALPAPPGSPTPELTVLVDGREVARRPLVSEFTLRVEVPPGSSRARVELRVSPLQRLPAPDNRRIGVLLRSIGFAMPDA